MLRTVRGLDDSRLERSGTTGRESIRFGPGGSGIERAEVFLSTCSYEPHRHDTYAIGVTTAGVQTFRYRGARRTSLPGQLHVLHPDEIHDGAAGTQDGFGYKILYIAPQLVQEALPGRSLPFVADPVHEPSPTTQAIASFLADVDEPISELSAASIAAAVADGLQSMSEGSPVPRTPIDIRAVELVRAYIAAHAREQTPASILEGIAGTDRFTIARHFRWAFGTSPDRYRLLRRLELARSAIENGQSLVCAAADCGFADQSHMTRQFKRTYGLTPTRWRDLTAPTGSPPPNAGEPPRASWRLHPAGSEAWPSDLPT